MKTLLKNNINFITTILLTLVIFTPVIFSGCKQESIPTDQTEISGSNSNSESTIIEETTEDNITKNTVTETESVTEEETTTELNYEELIDFDAEHPYMIRINRAQNFTTIYGLDKDGRYSVPYKVFVCSTGKEVGYTPLGSFTLGQKYDWRLMVDGTYAQYAIRIHGPIMLHSVPYYTQNKDDLEVKEYAKLGSPASLGCIRYNVESIKWIYDNCPDGTVVVIYDSEEEEPLLELPTLTPAKSKGKKAGWDPTDPDKKNPWNKKFNKKNNKNNNKNNTSSEIISETTYEVETEIFHPEN